MKVLITGFEPFHTVNVNPTQRLIEDSSSWIPREFALNHIQISTFVLPVSYQSSIKILDELVANNQPDIIIETGAHRNETKILLEKRAKNLNHSKIADNCAEVRIDQVIVADKAQYLYGNLCLEQLKLRLDSAGVANEISDNAGSFVCNHLYYWTLANYPEKKIGFLHFPVDLHSTERTNRLHQSACACMQNLLKFLVESY